MTSDEFPDSATVRRKLKEFEASFVKCLVELFECLPPLNQLTAVSVATRPDRANQAVSLLQYFESEAIPCDLLHASGATSANSTQREYFLTVSDAHFQKIADLRRDGAAADVRLGVARELVQDLAGEAAAELSRMFEYQLVLINESIALLMLARQAAECVIHVVKRRNRLLDRNSIVQGVVRGRPKIPDGAPKFISVIIGAKELKWNIFEIFKKPALRRELYNGGCGTGSCGGGSCGGSSGNASPFGRTSSDELQRTPWQFFTSARCDQMLYGYRGQMIEWDFVNQYYRLNSEDESTFSEEVSWRYDDFHRTYSPYRRLVGVDTVRDFCAAKRAVGGASPPVATFPSLAEFVKQMNSGGVWVRDEIQLVYRPLGVSVPLDVDIASRDDIELTRIGLQCRTTMDGTPTAEQQQEHDEQQKGEKIRITNAAIEVKNACDELMNKLDYFDRLESNSSPANRNGTLTTTSTSSSCRLNNSIAEQDVDALGVLTVSNEKGVTQV